MPKLFGKFNKSAVGRFKYLVNRASKEGRMPYINLLEKKQIFNAVEKVFTKKGKEANSIEYRKLQKEIFNRFRNSKKDILSVNEVGEVEKAVGIKKSYTKQIGSEYLEAINKEKRLAEKKRFEELKAKKAEKSAAKTEKIEEAPKPSRLEMLQKQIKAPKTSFEILNNKITGDTFKLGISNKKIFKSDKSANVEEAAGNKPLKSGGMFRRAVNPMILSNLPRMDSFNKPQQSDFEYEEAGQKPFQKSSDDKITLDAQIPKWKLDAYSEISPESSKSADSPETLEATGSQIDD